MHPLVARLHPALRTALLAWLLSRVVIWSAAPNFSMELADGAPLPGLLATFVDSIAASVPTAQLSQFIAFSPWIALEVTLFFAGVAVYRFARSTELPQLAERACWLWFFNPVLALSAGHWGAQMAAACGALTLAAVATHRPRRAVVAAVIATGCRLEFIILWPAMALAAWHHRQDKRHTPATLLMAAGAIPLAFAVWIGTTLHLAGSAHTSMRSVHGDVLWRDSFSLASSSTAELILLASLLVVAAISLCQIRRFPAWYVLGALPPLCWPFVQTPAIAASFATAWALPAFVYLATATDDRSLERPLIIAVAVAFTTAAFAL